MARGDLTIILSTPLARELDGGKGAAHHVGAARTGAGGSDAALEGVAKGLVHGIDGINGPQLGGDGIHDLVVVVTFPAHPLVVQADVAMSFHTARGDQSPPRVDDPGVRGSADILPHCHDLSVVADEHLAAGVFRSGHGLDVPILDQKHRS